MTPYQDAVQWYADNPGMYSLEEIIEAHEEVGQIIPLPGLFLLGRQINKDWPEARINDPWDVDYSGDCWHVWFAAGDWKQWETWPLYRKLPWVSMHRRDKLRIYPLSRFSALK